MSSPPPPPPSPPKNSLILGIFSFLVMSSLTFVAFYSSLILNDPAHYQECPGAKGPAAWSIWTFYISAYGGVVGAGYELYLILIGKTFEHQTVPFLQKIRGLNAGYIFTVGLLFVSFTDIIYLAFAFPFIFLMIVLLLFHHLFRMHS